MACFDPRSEVFNAAWTSLTKATRLTKDGSFLPCSADSSELAPNLKLFSSKTIEKFYQYVRQRHPDESLEDELKREPEEILERSSRMRFQALRALAFVVTFLAKNPDAPEASDILKDLNELTMWYKFLVANEGEGGATSRIAAYDLLSSLCVAKRLDLLSKDVYKIVPRIVGEKDRMATPAMWNALLAVSSCDEFWSQPESLRKGFFPELFRHFDRAGNGAGFTALSNSVVFLSMIPPAIWEAYGVENLSSEYLNRLWPPAQSKSTDHSSSLRAELECISFLLRRSDLKAVVGPTLDLKIAQVLDAVLAPANESFRLDQETFATLLRVLPNEQPRFHQVLCANKSLQARVSFIERALKCLRTTDFERIVAGYGNRPFENECFLTLNESTRAYVDAKFDSNLGQAICALLDVGQRLGLWTNVAYQIGLLLVEAMKTAITTPDAVTAKIAARLIRANQESCADLLFTAFVGVPDGALLFNELVVVTPRKRYESAGVLVKSCLNDDGEHNLWIGDDEKRIASWIDVSTANKRRLAASEAAATAIERKAFDDSSLWICKSLRAYGDHPQTASEVVLQWFLGQEHLFSAETPFDTVVIEDVASWLNSNSAWTSVDHRVKWASLCAMIMIPTRRFTSLPYPDSFAILLSLDVLAMETIRHFFNDEVGDAAWWAISKRSPDCDVVLPQFDSELGMRTASAALSNVASSLCDERAFHVLLASCDFEGAQLVELFLKAIQIDTEFALYVAAHALAEAAEQNASLDEQKSIENALNEAMLKCSQAIISAAEMQRVTTEVSLVDMESPSASPPPLTIFKSGDAVWYRPKDDSKAAATVVARHDEGIAMEDSFYTIRWWGEDHVRETQTTPDRLALRDSKGVIGQAAALCVVPEQMTLAQVQKLLAEARITGNRQESIRLMKLQAELLPKPKDTNEERARVEAERIKAHEDWKTSRRLKGTHQSEDDDHVNDDHGQHAPTQDKWEDRVSNALLRVSRFVWRKDVGMSAQERSPLVLAITWALPLVAPSVTKWTDEEIIAVCRVSRFALALCRLGGTQDPPVFSKFLNRVLVVAFSHELTDAVDLMAVLIKDPNTSMESLHGRLLMGFVASSLETDFTKRCAEIIPRMRFPSRLVVEKFNDLFARMVQDCSPSSLACFDVLYRYPFISSVASSSTTSSLEVQGSDVDQSKEFEEEPVLKILPSALVKFLELTFLDPDSNPTHVVVEPGMTLAWMLMLRLSSVAWGMSPSSREIISAWLRHDNLAHSVLGLIAAHLDFNISESIPIDHQELDDPEFVQKQIAREVQSSSAAIAAKEITTSKLCARAFFQTTHVLPALVRMWWSDYVVNRGEKENIMRFTSRFVTPFVLKRDMKELNDAVNTKAWDPKELLVWGSSSTKTVSISSFRDDSTLEMEISFPDAYPLFPPDVQCVKQIGVKPEKWKRWALQIIQLLSKRDGTLSDAVTLWKDNLDKEFEGVEPCPICYSVLHASDSSLPRLPCKTCKNVFHGACLSKWFASSHQSLCPLCKTSFLANKSRGSAE